MRTVHPGKIPPKSSRSNNSGTPNTVGKQLGTKERGKRFSRLKKYSLSIILGSLLGFTIGFTVSGFWSALINRCTACGAFGAEEGHRRDFYQERGSYYICQPEQRTSFFIPQTDDR